MEPKRSLQCSDDHAGGAYSEPVESSPHTLDLFQDPF
jgi:hypothetical protein